jgi:hypothetical protein
MPTENTDDKKFTESLDKKVKTVDIDTSGPGAEVIVPEDKDESVVDAKEKEATVTLIEEKEPGTTDQEPVEEKKEEAPKDDTKLEEYSKGVQNRIAKLTRKMREAERQREAATEYARALEVEKSDNQQRFKKLDTDYWKRFETNVTTGMEAAQKELSLAIEAGDAKAQVDANKRIATLAFENAKMQQQKEGREEDVKLSIDPKSGEYYTEIDKRIRVDFPHKFDKSETIQTTRPVQSVASANRSVKPGRQTVKLTPSQVAIAKKLGVPLEDYAKQLRQLTKEV